MFMSIVNLFLIRFQFYAPMMFPFPFLFFFLNKNSIFQIVDFSPLVLFNCLQVLILCGWVSSSSNFSDSMADACCVLCAIFTYMIYAPSSNFFLSNLSLGF